MNKKTDPANAATAALPLAPGSVAYALFEHMAREHGLTLVGSELDEIIRVVNAALDDRLRGLLVTLEYIAKADPLDNARYAAFRARKALEPNDSDQQRRTTGNQP